jgi:hypothetical protein
MALALIRTVRGQAVATLWDSGLHEFAQSYPTELGLPQPSCGKPAPSARTAFLR